MKYFLILIFLTQTTLSFGQIKFKYEYLIDSWSKVGNLNSADNVIHNGSRAVNSHLTLTFSNKTINFRQEEGLDGLYIRTGEWLFSDADSSVLIFNFTKLFSYETGPNPVIFNSSKSFRIKKLTQEELILEELLVDDGKTSLFKKESRH